MVLFRMAAPVDDPLVVPFISKLGLDARPAPDGPGNPFHPLPEPHTTEDTHVWSP